MPSGQHASSSQAIRLHSRGARSTEHGAGSTLRSVRGPGRWYAGVTSDLAARLDTHNAGQNRSTATWRPWTVELCIEFRTERMAWRFERYLKSGSGHASAKRDRPPASPTVSPCSGTTGVPCSRLHAMRRRRRTGRHPCLHAVGRPDRAESCAGAAQECAVSERSPEEHDCQPE